MAPPPSSYRPQRNSDRLTLAVGGAVIKCAQLHAHNTINCAKFVCAPACCMSDSPYACTKRGNGSSARRLRTRLAAVLHDLPCCKLRRFCFGLLLSLPKALQLGSGELSGCLRELSPKRVQLSRPRGPRSLLGRARPPPRHACAIRAPGGVLSGAQAIVHVEMLCRERAMMSWVPRNSFWGAKSRRGEARPVGRRLRSAPAPRRPGSSAARRGFWRVSAP